MTPLRQRMIEDMRLRNYAPLTIKVYVERVAAFAKHFHKSPELMGPPEIRAYLLHLVQERHVSWSYYNQTVAALRFLYAVTLQRPNMVQALPFGKRPRPLPAVFSQDDSA